MSGPGPAFGPQGAQRSGGSVRVRTYTGGAPADAAMQFQRDAAEAATYGFQPVSQAWQGMSLIVTYEQIPVEKPRRRTARVGIGIVLGGIAVAAGSFLPWITFDAGAGTTIGGLDAGGTGVVTLPAGVVMILAGLVALRRGWAWLLGLAAAIAAGLTATVEIASIPGRVASGQLDASASAGLGLWLIVAGAVIGGISAVACGVRGRRAAPVS